MTREKSAIKALEPLAATQTAINKAVASIDMLDICGVSEAKNLASYIIEANLMHKATIPKQIRDTLAGGQKSFVRFRWPTKDHIYASCKTRGAMLGMQIRTISIKQRQGRITSI
jgi:hypothetical protein